MLDIKFIRENPEIVKAAVKNKKARVDVDALLAIDEERRKMRTEIENLNQEKNLAAKEKNVQRGKLVKASLLELETAYAKLDAEFQQLMYA